MPLMEPGVRRMRNQLGRRLRSLAEFLGKLLARSTPRAREVRSQRMCPFCGLITSRSKSCCLECGKALGTV